MHTHTAVHKLYTLTHAVLYIDSVYCVGWSIHVYACICICSAQSMHTLLYTKLFHNLFTEEALFSLQNLELVLGTLN